MTIPKFLASTYGRLARSIAGVALILVGLLTLGGTAGLILAMVGVVPLAAGVFDFCLFAPLFGAPLSGKAIREM
jgi:hypothetical protein